MAGCKLRSFPERFTLHWAQQKSLTALKKKRKKRKFQNPPTFNVVFNHSVSWTEEPGGLEAAELDRLSACAHILNLYRAPVELSSRYYSLTLNIVICSVPLPLHSVSSCSLIHSSICSSLLVYFHFLAPRTATTRLYFLNPTKTQHLSWWKVWILKSARSDFTLLPQAQLSTK